MEDAAFILKARHLATMTGPPVENGVVVVAQGLVRYAGPLAALPAPFTDLSHQDLGDVLLMPGLVNAHTHLELSACAPVPPPASFVEWVLGLYSRAGLFDDDRLRAAVRAGAGQSLSFGVTCVGDVATRPHLSRPVLAECPLRAVSFGEVRGIGSRAPLAAGMLQHATEPPPAGVVAGVSPHAPYSTGRAAYEACLAAASATGLPLATHLAELPEERPFLADHAGPLRELLDVLGITLEGEATFAGSPVAWAESLGLLQTPCVLAHVNDVDDDDMQRLAAGRASVCYCPRTHAFFGHRPHRFVEMLAAGVNVCLGTDSRASSPDLNLLAEAALARRQAPSLPATVFLEMITTRAAAALCQPVGRLVPGHWADMVAFPAAAATPEAAAEAVLEQQPLPSAVWQGGTSVEVRDQ